MDTKRLWIPLTSSQKQTTNNESSRWDKQKGHFSLTLAVPLSENEEYINLQESIFPFGSDGNVIDVHPDYAKLDDALENADPTIILENPVPNLSFAFTAIGRFSAMSLKLQRYATKKLEKKTKLVGVTAFWQPKDTYNKIFSVDEDMLVSDFLLKNRKLKFEERGYIDANNIEVADVLEKLRELMLSFVVSAGLKVDVNSLMEDYRAQQACSIIANRYPFVLQHVFKALPNLNIMKLEMNVLGSDDSLYVYRYVPEWFSGAAILNKAILTKENFKVYV